MPISISSRLLTILTILTIGALASASACAEAGPEPEPPPPSRSDAAAPCEDPGARRVVERLGERLKAVPLLAPDSVLVPAIREAYAPLVTPELLALWSSDPSSAPGREVSSPWPERIEIGAVEPAEDGGCRVEGEIVLVTSVEPAQGGAAARTPVVLRVVEDGDGGWRVSAFDGGAPPADDPASSSTAAAAHTAADAAGVLRRYYAALEARDFRGAYGLWSGEGAASGQSFEDFAAGYARTARVEVEVGEPGRVEGAAGSRYVEIPVTIRAETVDGEEQRFEGTYTLRRSVVDGASEEQRLWRIHSAEVERVRR